MVNINDCVIDIGSNIYLTAPLFIEVPAPGEVNEPSFIYVRSFYDFSIFSV